jgi:HD-GYP domain-containing protein (c-di-GMP phosphodiesterase class II)
VRRVSIFGVTPGMRLAYDIKGPVGELLLRSGMALEHSHLRQLRQRNCLFVDVLDGVTDDIEMGETISDRVHIKTTQALQNMHAVLKTAAESTVDTGREEFASRDLKSRGFARNTKESKPVYALADAAAALVDEVLDSNATLGLNQIRFYDDYTFQHSISTAIAAAILGRELGWDKETLTHLSTGCLMHDIGKIFVDRDIINKPGRLTADEIELVKQHAQIGYEASLQIFGPGVLSNHIPFQHHERQEVSPRAEGDEPRGAPAPED